MELDGVLYAPEARTNGLAILHSSATHATEYSFLNDNSVRFTETADPDGACDHAVETSSLRKVCCREDFGSERNNTIVKF